MFRRATKLNGCELPEQVRACQESPENDCVQCHMPKLKSNDIVHTSTTDHRILLRTRQQLLAPELSPPTHTFPHVLLNGETSVPRTISQSMGRELAIALASGDYHGCLIRRRTQADEVLGVPESRARQGNQSASRAISLRARLEGTGHSCSVGAAREAISLIDSVLKAAPLNEEVLDECLTYALALDDILETASSAPARQAGAGPLVRDISRRLAGVSLPRVRTGTMLSTRAREGAPHQSPSSVSARMFVVQCPSPPERPQTSPEDEFATLVNFTRPNATYCSSVRRLASELQKTADDVP